MFLIIMLRDEELKNFHSSRNLYLNCILFDLTCSTLNVFTHWRQNQEKKGVFHTFFAFPLDLYLLPLYSPYHVDENDNKSTT